MSKADNQTRPGARPVDDFLAGVEDQGKRGDALALRTLFERIAGEPARMWGPGIVGCGAYRYRYDSGREGTMARLGFAPRARELVLYLPGLSGCGAALARLGKVRTGKGCLYLKRLADIDPAALEDLLRCSLDYSRMAYPEQG